MIGAGFGESQNGLTHLEIRVELDYLSRVTLSVHVGGRAGYGLTRGSASIIIIISLLLISFISIISSFISVSSYD